MNSESEMLHKERITPACAGKSTPEDLGYSGEGDHPRMRGEEPLEVANWQNLAGSPPHARGRAILSGDYELDKRITPACAGKSQGGGH